MTHTLISFLGWIPKRQQDSGQKYQSGYTQTVYDIEGEHYEESFFGLALNRHLKPDRLHLLGTAGSMWDVLLDRLDLSDDEGLWEKRIAIADAACHKAVTQEQLAALEPEVSRVLDVSCSFRLIPYGRNEAEQLHILELMAEDLKPGDIASLDVTHGYRHLPMLTLISAMYLQVVRKVRINGIFYGAFAMGEEASGVAPMVRLDGLLRIGEWVRALHTFDKDGDYGVFADLLRRDGVADPVVDCLTRAAFFERTFSVQKAGAALGSMGKILEDDLPGISRLFTEQLRERLHWRKYPDTYVRQRELALSYLNNGDYPRAAIFAYEAFITSLINKNAGEREHERDDRCRAEQEFLEGQRGNPSQKQNYLLLEKLRNALAHGSKPSDKDVRQIATDENKLRNELQRLIRALLPNIR